MKQFLLLLLMLFALPCAAFASLPKLETKDPSFAGFTGSFIKFGKFSGNNRPFTMRVEFGQWAFEASGNANAAHNTEDLDILLEDIVAIVAYYDAKGTAKDGSTYQAGLFDLMIYLDDEPIRVSNVKFDLTGGASAGAKVLEQAKTWNFQAGQVFKMGKYEREIVKAQAIAIDRSDIAREEAAAKKRVADSVAREKKRVEDSVAKVEKRKNDSIMDEKKRRKAAAMEEKKRAEEAAAAEKTRKRDSMMDEKKRRKAAAIAERKRVEDSIEAAEIAAEKKRAKSAASKKKRPQAFDDDDDEITEKKRAKSAASKKKRPQAFEDDEDEAPKKKRRKKRDDD